MSSDRVDGNFIGDIEWEKNVNDRKSKRKTWNSILFSQVIFVIFCLSLPSSVVSEVLKLDANVTLVPCQYCSILMHHRCEKFTTLICLMELIMQSTSTMFNVTLPHFEAYKNTTSNRRQATTTDVSMASIVVGLNGALGASNVHPRLFLVHFSRLSLAFLCGIEYSQLNGLSLRSSLRREFSKKNNSTSSSRLCSRICVHTEQLQLSIDLFWSHGCRPLASIVLMFYLMAMLQLFDELLGHISESICVWLFLRYIQYGCKVSLLLMKWPNLTPENVIEDLFLSHCCVNTIRVGGSMALSRLSSDFLFTTIDFFTRKV